MALKSNQRGEPDKQLQEGAIYGDRFDNVVQLHSICGTYCLYVYVSQKSQRSSIHGSVTGLCRRDVFAAEFVFVAASVEHWIRSQRKQSKGWDYALQNAPPGDQSMPYRLDARDWRIRLGVVSRNVLREHSSRRAS